MFCFGTLLQLIKSVGSWPLTNDSVIGTWDELTFDLERSLSQLHLYGFDGLFGFGIGMDDKDTSKNRLQVRVLRGLVVLLEILYLFSAKIRPPTYPIMPTFKLKY